MFYSTCWCWLISVVIISSTNVQTIELNSTESCADLYEKGVQAYLENEFEDCVNYFENALKKYNLYMDKLLYCRIKCKEEAEMSYPLFKIDIEHLLFYERAVKNTLCILKCKKQYPSIFGDFNINPETEELFEDRKPYEYLHLCYYQTKQMQKAANAAYTYLVSHPDDKIISSNLKSYSKMEEVNMNKIVNHEAENYVYLYVHGTNAYENEDWENVVHYMEESLVEYLNAEEKCRAKCEGPFDPGWFPDFIPSISNHFTYSLNCKRKCSKKLSSLNGEIYEDLVASHYHYLQFAYFKLKRLKEACRSVASYLLFYPEDETMLSNMEYYRTLPKVQNDYFTPYDEAIRYMQREKYETKLLNFINQQFSLLSEMKSEFSKKIRVIMTDKQLNGPNRFVSDGVAKSAECRSLMNIAKMFAKLGDGYQGIKSPHTIMEKFEGITLSRATLLVYFGLLHRRYLDIYLNLTELVRKQVKNQFRLNDELYFDYTHLVCRSALNSTTNRTDFSHTIHADNCNIFPNGTCSRSPPAYFWRDFSAILYLNDNFDGGQFVFAKDMHGNHIQASIKPKCGRMVAFTAGVENLHGVKAVKMGSRCALAMWFTRNESHSENDRVWAKYILENQIIFNSNLYQ